MFILDGGMLLSLAELYLIGVLRAQPTPVIGQVADPGGWRQATNWWRGSRAEDR